MTRLYYAWIILFVSSISMVAFRRGTRLLTDVADTSFDSTEMIRMISIGIVLVIIVGERFNIKKMDEPFDILPKGLLGFMFLYSSLAMSSSFYSGRPLYTIYKASEMLIAVYLAHLTLWHLRRTGDSALRLINLQYTLFFIMILISWVGVILFKEASIAHNSKVVFNFILHGTLAGIGSNYLAGHSVILLLVCLSRSLRATKTNRSRMYWMLIPPLSITMLFCQSRAVMFIAVAGFFALLLLHKRAGFLLIVPVIIGMAYIAIPMKDSITEYMLRGHDFKLFLTMSNRTVFWRYAWGVFLASPIVGYGYGVGERFIVSSVFFGEQSSNIHNSYVAALLDLGVLGCALLLLAVLGTLFQSIRYAVAPKSGLRLSQESKDLTVELSVIMMSIAAISFKSSSIVSISTSTMLLLAIMVHVQSLQAPKSGTTKKNNDIKIFE